MKFPLLLLALLFLGCSSKTVRLQVEQPPNWNTAGIQRIMIMPFEYSGFDHQQVASYFTTEATTRIQRMGRFTLVSPEHIRLFRKRGENIANQVDAIFTGKIVDIQSQDSRDASQYYDRKKKQNIVHYTYTREVVLTISYSLERARDGSLIGTTTKTVKASDSQPNSSSLKSVFQLIHQTNALGDLAHYLVPYTVIETRSLMDEKSEDKILREKMKNAASFVDQQSYRIALYEYLKISNEYNSFAAMYNASMMHEALGEISAAIELMQKADASTGNPQAKSEIVRLNKRLQVQEKVDSEYKGDIVRQIDKVIAHALSETQRVLPQEARVWFVKNESRERDLANSVADNMTSVLIQKGITVVERDNAELIEKEFLQQTSGFVNDDDILKLGYQAGANIIIIIAIPGIGDMRRLQLRILDVESGRALLQSDMGDGWKL